MKTIYMVAESDCPFGVEVVKEVSKMLTELEDIINKDFKIADVNSLIEEIKKNTRRFAKRQLTWYRKDESIIWFDYKTSSEEIIKTIKERVSH